MRDQVEGLWEGQLAAVASVGPAVPAIAMAVEAALPRLRAGGRLAYAGAGSSGRLGAQDGAELEPTFDWPRDRLVLLIAGGVRALTQAVENAEDDAGDARAQVAEAGIGADDVVIGVAASGGTPFTLEAVAAARQLRGADDRARQQSPAARCWRRPSIRSWSPPAPSRSPVRRA